MLTGCGNEIPSMSQQQQNMVVEYATGTLLKYSGSYHNKMIRRESAEEESAVMSEEQENAAQTETVQQDLADTGSESADGTDAQTEMPDDVPVISANEVADAQSLQSSAPLSLAEVLSLAQDFRIAYNSYEICDAYSGADEGDIAFQMTASAGKKLLVLKFDVTNISGQEQLLDVFSQNAKAKVSAAGNTQNALLTMLDNDLLTASTMMMPDETATYVIVTQISEDSVVDGVLLTVTCQGNSTQYQF